MSERRGMVDRVRLGMVDFDSVTELETCRHIADAIANRTGGFLVTANLDHLLRCSRHLEYRTLVQKADVVVADGMPLIWASRVQGTPLPERVAGSSLCWSLAKTLAQAGRSLFLLGGNPGVAERASRVLVERFPGLRIAGTHCPPFGFENESIEIDRIRDMLRQSKPDVVYVALGSPKQEELIERFRGDFPETWWMGVGISLSFITGDVQRAPPWVQKIGLEWIHRLVQEPRRLVRRYLIDGVPFGLWLLGTSAIKRVRSPKRRVT